MKLIKKIGIILKETFLSPRSTSIVTEEGSKITVGDCDCICLNCKWEGKIKKCNQKINSKIIFTCPECERDEIVIKTNK